MLVKMGHSMVPPCQVAAKVVARWPVHLIWHCISASALALDNEIGNIAWCHRISSSGDRQRQKILMLNPFKQNHENSRTTMCSTGCSSQDGLSRSLLPNRVTEKEKNVFLQRFVADLFKCLSKKLRLTQKKCDQIDFHGTYRRKSTCNASCR